MAFRGTGTTNPADEAPLPPAPVIMTCFGHAGIGLGAEAIRQSLIELGADPLAPTLKGEKDQKRILQRYGSTVMLFGEPSRRGGEIPLIPRALLVDLDPRASNLILQSYPQLFAMREKHIISGTGGAARNWAEGRRRFREDMAKKYNFKDHIKALAPEDVRGFVVPFAMGGGTGSSFACAFLEFVKTQGKGNEVIASIGVLPDFGYDPVIYGPACVNMTMNLDYQIRFSDAPIIVDNSALRSLAGDYDKELTKKSSIVDDLKAREQKESWKEYRNLNLVGSEMLTTFIASFTRETEWDFSNYRTWLSQKPKFVIPWLIPVIAEGRSDVDGLLHAVEDRRDAVLFDFEADQIPEGGPRDSACVLVKVHGDLTRQDREALSKVVMKKFPSVKERKVIFIRIPSLEREPAAACVLVNTKSVAPKLLELVKEAEESWDDYKHEYIGAGLEEAEFKESVIRVVNHFS